MRVRGGKGSGGACSPRGSVMPRGHSRIGMAIVNCAAAVPFTMAKTGAVQIRSQLAVVSLSPPSGQPWHSGIDIAPPSAIAISNAIAFALTACTIVLAANTTRNITAMSEANLRILNELLPGSSNVHSRNSAEVHGRNRHRKSASSRTTRQLRDILVESLCGEFQSLDRGQIGKDRLAERLRRHADLQCHHERLDTVGSLRRHDHAA